MVNVKRHKREIKQVGMTPQEYRELVKRGEAKEQEVKQELMQHGRTMRFIYPEISGKPVKIKYEVTIS